MGKISSKGRESKKDLPLTIYFSLLSKLILISLWWRMDADGGEGKNCIRSGVAGINNFDTMHPMNIPNAIHATFLFNNDRRRHDSNDDDDENSALLDWHKMSPMGFDDTRRSRASSLSCIADDVGAIAVAAADAATPFSSASASMETPGIA